MSTTSASSAREAAAPTSDVPGCDPARDRAAIRAMSGEFEVSFSFVETEPLTPGYEPRGPYRTLAREVIEVLEDTGSTISLQHVLLLVDDEGTAQAMKHWRQDWTFEDRDLVEFRGKGTWAHRAVDPKDLACTWSQAVFEVTDSPRYESFGRWRHANATSTWTSQETWRPLPRREYTIRSDYDVLVGVNRHIVDDTGWTHEQDNVKLVLEGPRALVKERGHDRYQRATLKDAKVARDYLRSTGMFWGTVRAEWQAAMRAHPSLGVRAEVGGKPLYATLFPMAEEAQTLPASALAARVHAAIAPFVEVPPRTP